MKVWEASLEVTALNSGTSFSSRLSSSMCGDRSRQPTYLKLSNLVGSEFVTPRRRPHQRRINFPRCATPFINRPYHQRLPAPAVARGKTLWQRSCKTPIFRFEIAARSPCRLPRRLGKRLLRPQKPHRQQNQIRLERLLTPRHFRHLELTRCAGSFFHSTRTVLIAPTRSGCAGFGTNSLAEIANSRGSLPQTPLRFPRAHNPCGKSGARWARDCPLPAHRAAWGAIQN